MPNSNYTETKNATLDARADKEEEQSQLIKAAKQAEIAGDKNAAAELKEEADVIGGDLIATAAADQEVLDISTAAETLDETLPPGKPNPNAGKPGYTASGQIKT
jgi:hypothetical protein